MITAPRLSRVSFALIAVTAVVTAVVGATSLSAQAPSPSDSVAAHRIEPQEILAARGQGVVGGAAALRVRVDSAKLGTNPTLADLLRAVPTVHVRTNSRGEIELSVRGSESRQAAISLNGIPLSPGWDGRADAGLVPLGGVSSVRVIRSTGSLLGGPNAIGGVVDLSIDAPTRGFEPRLSVGSDQTGARLLSASVAGLQSHGRQGVTHWSAGGGYRDLPGLVRAAGVADAVPGATLRTNTDVRSADLFLSGGWHATNGAGIHALVSAYEAERGAAPELHLAEPRRWRYPAQARVLAQLRAQAPPLTWRAGTTTLEGTAAMVNGLTRIETYADDRFTTIDGRESGDERMRTLRAAGRHVLHAGSELRSAVTMQEINYDESLDGAAPSRYAQRLWSAGLEGQRVLGTRTLLNVGLVVDRAMTLESGDKLPSPTRSVLGWRLGATTQLRPAVRVHASASERGRFPALRELYSGALNRFQPNPELRPERLRTVETGVSWGAVESGDGFGTQLVAFANRLEDGVVRVGFPGTNRFIRVNRDRTDALGAEMMLGWRGAGGGAVQLEVTGQRVRIADQQLGGSGRKPEHLPAVRAMLDATIPARAGVVVGASLQHLGAQYCVNPETDQDVALSRQAVLGATAQRSWRLGGRRGTPGGTSAAGFRGLRLLLGLDNVTDAAVYEQCGLPRAGRTLRLGITLE